MSAERREKLVELVNEYLSCEVTDSSALVLELKDATNSHRLSPGKCRQSKRNA